MPVSSAVQALETNTTANDLILDLGTKDGEKLKNCSATVVGIDVDDSKYPNQSSTNFTLGDGRKLPFKSNAFDYVYCGAVLEHVDGSGAVITEAARVLKSAGVAYFGFPNRISLFQPHSGIPRYYSLLPNSVGQLLAPYLLSKQKQRYYERALFPLTPVTARRYLHANFEEVSYTMRLSGQIVTENRHIQSLFRAANWIATRPPFKWPYELFWPNATYRCLNPKQGTV